MPHLFGLNPIPAEAPRAPRMFLEPADFASVAELARGISGCAWACIRLENRDTGEMRLAMFPERAGVQDLPEALLSAGPGQVALTGLEMQHALAVSGLPDLAFWAGFALKSREGRRLGVLGLMDVQPRDLSEGMLAQLGHLAALLSRGIGMAASTIRATARQSLGLIEDLADLEPGAASPAVTGLLRYAAGREPLPEEAMALRRNGLAEMAGGVLILTPMARDILYTHGFRLAKTRGGAKASG